MPTLLVEPPNTDEAAAAARLAAVLQRLLTTNQIEDNQIKDLLLYFPAMSYRFWMTSCRNPTGAVGYVVLSWAEVEGLRADVLAHIHPDTLNLSPESPFDREVAAGIAKYLPAGALEKAAPRLDPSQKAAFFRLFAASPLSFVRGNGLEIQQIIANALSPDDFGAIRKLLAGNVRATDIFNGMSAD